MLSLELVNHSDAYLDLEVFMFGTFKVGGQDAKAAPKKSTGIDIPFHCSCVITRGIIDYSKIFFAYDDFCFNSDIYRQGVAQMLKMKTDKWYLMLCAVRPCLI